MMADGDRLATWAISAQKDRDRLAAVIEKVRALCEEAGKCMFIDGLDLAGDILALLPPATQPTQEDRFKPCPHCGTPRRVIQVDVSSPEDPHATVDGLDPCTRCRFT